MSDPDVGIVESQPAGFLDRGVKMQERRTMIKIENKLRASTYSTTTPNRSAVTKGAGGTVRELCLAVDSLFRAVHTRAAFCSLALRNETTFGARRNLQNEPHVPGGRGP